MVELLPAIKKMLAKRGILPQPYPYVMRTMLGSAIATLCVVGVLLFGFGIYKIGQGVMWVSSSVQTKISDFMTVDPTIKIPELPMQPVAPAVPKQEPIPAVVVTITPTIPDPAPPPSNLEPPSGSLSPGPLEHSIRVSIQNNPLPYSEASTDLADAAKKIDFALLQTLIRMGVDASHFYFLGKDYKTVNGQSYLLQRMRIWLPYDHQFVQSLQETLSVWSDEAILETTELAPGHLKLRLGLPGIPTHELWVVTVGPEFVLPPPISLTEHHPKMTIVIDDLGESISAAQALLALNVPLSFSIWPQSRYAQQVAQLAKDAGREVLIHQPMEAMQSPYVKTGPGNLRVSMTEEEVKETLAENVKRLPQADGLNNHMGSRYTKTPKAIEQLSKLLAQHGLFALDSLTHPESIFYSVARQQGIPAYQRAVFLDDGKPGKATVLAELARLEKLALSHGQAIAIGHPHPETIAALKEWLPKRDAKILLVPLRHLEIPVETLDSKLSE